MITKSKEHLIKSQEDYFSHFVWAERSGIRLILAGLASLVHGLVPGLFPGTAAMTVIDLYHKRLIDHPNDEYQDYINRVKK
jgi:hypothetical protein